MAKKGKASQLVVWVLLGLLIVGLAGFGTGNFGGSVRSVASVGSSEIDLNTYGRALQQEMQAYAEATGETAAFTDLQAQGLDRAVLQGLLGTAALDEATRMAGLSVGDERVSQQIVQIPAFQGVNGSFDREAYEFMLERSGMTVAGFEDSVRAELSRNLLQAALSAGLAPQPAYADAIYRYVGERRTLSIVRLDETALDAPVPAPDAAAVQAEYEANPGRYTLPERKKITYAWLTPAMVAETIDVSEDELRAEYAAREDYNMPERRIVERLAFADTAAAQNAMDAIASGTASFDDYLTERNLTVDDVTMGEVARDDLEAAAAEAVFALSEPGVAGPAQSAIGPALFRVALILDAQSVPFEDARQELLTDLRLERAERQIVDRIDPLEDLLAGGATLEELAEETDMQLGTIDWAGPVPDSIASYDLFNAAAATVGPDDFPEIAQLDDGALFALRLDEIVAPTLQPLDSVRDAATTAAHEDAVRAALKTRADAILAALDAGQSLTEQGLGVETVPGVTRTAIPDAVPLDASESIFTMGEGETQIVEDGATLVLLHLDAILPPDPQDANAGLIRQALTQQASEQIAQDVLTQIARAVEASEGISINQAALNAVHSQLP